MKIKTSLRYQLQDSKNSFIIFYGVIIALNLLLVVMFTLLSRHFSGNAGNFTFGGVESATAIFLFVVGLCSFKENFYMLVQNGTSRRSLFIGRIGASAVLALAAAVIDKLLSLMAKGIAGLLGSYTSASLFEMVYNWPGIPGHVSHLFYLFASYLFYLMVGYFITVLFFRMNAGGKIAVSVGVPVTCFIVYPLVDSLLLGGVIARTIAKAQQFAFGLQNNQPWMAVLSYLVLAALFGLFSWLLMRRARVK